MTTLSVIPDRTVEQRATALERANHIRFTRAQWKRALKARQVEDPVAVFRDPPAEFEAMKVGDAMLAVPKVGAVRIGKVLRAGNVSPSKTLVGLSPRQRAVIVAEVTAAVERDREYRARTAHPHA